MKFKNYVFILALLIAPKSWGFNICHPLAGWNIMSAINVMGGTDCYQNRNLKDNTKEICECISRLSQAEPRLKEGKDIFNDRMLNAVQKNILTLATTQTKLEKDLGIRGKIKKKRSDVEDLLKNYFPKDSAKLSETSKELSKNIHKYDFCGFTIDEYRRSTRIPGKELLDPADDGTQTGQWDDYLAANPDLLSISVNLNAAGKLEFRDKILNEFRRIRKDAPSGQNLYNKLNVEIQKDNTVASLTNDTPEDNLWVTLDESFQAGGKIRGILSEYSGDSLEAQKNNINIVKGFLDSGKGGFDINYRYLLENDGAWDLYFNNNTEAGQNCSSAKAKTISFAFDALSCVQNVSGFCALYDSTKDVDVSKKQRNNMSELQFEPLLSLQNSYDASIAKFHKQGELLCSSNLKVSHLTDAKGKPIESKLDFRSFKKGLCDENGYVINQSTKIEMNQVKLACENKDNSKLLGYYHRLVKDSEFSDGTNQKLGEGEFLALKISSLRSFIREKSRFNLPTENDEGNITTAIGSGNSKEARRVLASRIAEDRVYFDNIKASSSGAANTSTVKSVPTTTTAPSTASTQIAPAEMPVMAGYSSSAVAAAKVEQQQILNEESKTIAKTKQQISSLENQLASDPSPGNPETLRLEKQIQELRAQLASSETRYQSALDTLKKVNQAAVTDNNEKSSSNNQVGRTQASTQNLNTDNNVYNSQSGSQGQAKLGQPGAAQPGKLTGSGGSNSAAGSTNKALLQANNVDPTGGSFAKYSSGLILQTVKNEKNEEVGLVADPKVFQKFKDKDKNLYAQYIQEMLDKNIDTLIIKNGDLVLRYKLVGKDSDNYNLQEEHGPISISERKYFSKDLKNVINSNIR